MVDCELKRSSTVNNITARSTMICYATDPDPDLDPDHDRAHPSDAA